MFLRPTRGTALNRTATLTDRQPGGNGELADRRLWQIAAVRDLGWLVLLLFLLWFGYYLRAIFTPVLIAVALAYVFDPPITLAEKRWRVPRPATITILLTVALLATVGLAIWLLPLAIQQVVGLAQALPGWIDQLAQKADIDLAAAIDQIDLEARVKALQEDPMSVVMPGLRAVLAGSGPVADAIGNVAGTATYVGVTLALIPIYFFFFAWRFWPMVRSVEPYIPGSQRRRIVHLASRMDNAVAGFIRGRLIIAAIMAVLFSVGWALCGVPYWLLLGLAGGILGIIPFIGGIVWPLAIALKYMQMTSGADAPGFDWMAILLWPTVVFAIVQFLEGWVLTPWIGGKSVNLDTVSTIIVVFIGGALGGMYGLLLCIPIAACIKILLVEEALPRLRQWAADN